MLQRTDQSERQRLAKARAAARKRRYRARLASGGAVLAVPTRDINKLIDALVTLRWLDISVSEERKQIGAAAGALLDDRRSAGAAARRTPSRDNDTSSASRLS